MIIKSKDGTTKEVGRRGIHSSDRKNVSWRAAEGKLVVVNLREGRFVSNRYGPIMSCPRCHHHKVLQGQEYVKCARCKLEL